MITWHFQSVAHTVTWDAQPGSVTDIAATSSANVSRNFTVAGTYHYHCSIHPSMTGVITVQ
jgi:plastocyanin